MGQAVVKVQKGWRLTVPEEIRPANIKEGDYVLMEVSEQRPDFIVMKKVSMH